MRLLFLTTVILVPLATPVFAAAGCEAQEQQLMAEAQRINAQASSMGICQAARSLAQIYSEAAQLLRRCQTLDPTGQDAGAYAQGAEQAQQTANASCE